MTKKADMALKPTFTYWCWGVIIACQTVPNFISTPIGVQLLANSIFVTALGALFSIKLNKSTQEESSSLMTRTNATPDEDDDETIGASEAMQFPIIASISLVTLYILINMINKALISGLFSIYICMSAVYALGFYLEHWLTENNIGTYAVLFKVDYNLWYVVGSYHLKYDVSMRTINGFAIAFAIASLYMYNGFWVMSNLIGITLSLGAIKLLKIKDAKTGLLVLWGLFFYDIFWVFKTDVMVSVAKNLDVPIKLKFPLNTSLEKFSILGLGDMIIPGLYVALCLKYDVDRYVALYKPKSFANFKSTYFNFAIIGYSLSILTTYVCMTWFNHAQPALLYIVPGLTIFTLIPALAMGDFKNFWAYDSTTVEKANKPASLENEVVAELEAKPKED